MATTSRDRQDGTGESGASRGSKGGGRKGGDPNGPGGPGAGYGPTGPQGPTAPGGPGAYGGDPNGPGGPGAGYGPTGPQGPTAPGGPGAYGGPGSVNGAETQPDTTYGAPISKTRVPGSIGYVGNPSLGQVLGSVLGGVLGGVIPGGGLLNSAPDLINGDFNAAPTGGVIGKTIDGITGQTPGQTTGYDTGFGERTTRDNQGIGRGGGGPRQGQVLTEADATPPLGGVLQTIMSQPGAWPPKPKSLAPV